MSDQRLYSGLSCDDVSDMAGVYVLGALDTDDAAKVRAHLAACPQEHPEIAELGGVVPALAVAVDEVDAPAQLRRRVLDAYAADIAPAPATAVAPRTIVEPPRERRSILPRWMGWAAAAAAVLVVVVVGVWALGVQSRANDEAARAQVLSDAINVLVAPDSTVALLTGSGSAEGASGFAAFGADGEGYVVIADVPQAPAGMTYQAWYIVEGTPLSAGVMAVDSAGYMLAEDVPSVDGMDFIALTVEPAGGSAEPTADPVIVGELRSRSGGVEALRR